MMPVQLGLALARAEGEEGIRAVTAAAERREPGVSDLMYAYLVKFARNAERKHRFVAEEVSLAYAADASLIQPHDMRVWGGVFQRAMGKGVITIADFNGVRTLGHGVRGAKRYRSLISGKRWTEVMPSTNGEGA